jgi:hypothetical protein
MINFQKYKRNKPPYTKIELEAQRTTANTAKESMQQKV